LIIQFIKRHIVILLALTHSSEQEGTQIQNGSPPRNTADGGVI
jgi:hypothetical protein